MGALNQFLCAKVVQEKDTSEIWTGEEAYTTELLKKFKMEESKPMSTPV